MDLYRCTECVLRLQRPILSLRDASLSFAKRQRITANGPQSTVRTRLFGSSTARQADNSPLSTDSKKQTNSRDRLSSLFDDSVPVKTRPARRRTTPPPSNSGTTDTPATNSLLSLLDAIKSRPSSGPLSSMVNSQGELIKTPPLKLEQAPFKLGPVLGRTVQVDESRGRDVGAAFRQLEILARRNSIKRDSMSQRFYERPGLKRKRLKSQRYRNRFKRGFQEMLARVETMRKMGW